MSIVFINYKIKKEFSEKLKKKMAEKANELQIDLLRNLDNDKLKWLFSKPLITKRHFEIQKILDDFKRLLKCQIVTVWEKNENKNISLLAYLCDTQNIHGYEYGIPPTNYSENDIVSNSLYNSQNEINSLQIECSDKQGNKIFVIPFYITTNCLLCATYNNEKIDTSDIALLKILVKRVQDAYEIQTKLTALDDLSKIGNWLNTNTDNKKEFLDFILFSFARIMKADEAILHVFNQQSKTFLEPKKFSYFYPRSIKPKLDVPNPNGTSYYVIKNGLLIIEDIQLAKKNHPNVIFQEDPNRKACIGLRLLANGETLGVLFINYNHKTNFSPENLFIAYLYADYCAAVLKTKSLITELSKKQMEDNIENENLKTKNKELEKLLDIFKNIPSNNPKKDVTSDLLVDQIVYLKKKLEDLLKADSVSIFEYDSTYEEFFINDELLDSISDRDTIVDYESSLSVIKNDEVIFEADTTNSKYFSFKENSFTYMHKVKSLVAAPLFVHGEPIGIMWIDYTQQKHSFSDWEKNIVKTITQFISLTIKTLRIVHETNSQISALFQCLQSVEKSKNLNELLHQFLLFLVPIIKADCGAIYKVDEGDNSLSLASSHFEFKSTHTPQTININHFFTHFITNKEKSIYIKNLSAKDSTKDKENNLLIFTGSKSRLSVPIKNNNKLEGIIIIESIKPDFCNTQNRKLVEILSEAISILIKERDSIDQYYTGYITNNLDNIFFDAGPTIAHRFGNELGLAEQKLVEIKQKSKDFNMKKFSHSQKIVKLIFSPFESITDVVRVNDLINESIKEYNLDFVTDSMKQDIAISPNNEMVETALVKVNKTGAITQINELFSNAWFQIQQKIDLQEISQGEISLHSFIENNNVIIDISSNGGVINKENWETIFIMNNSRERALPSVHQGFGFGLPFAKLFFTKNYGNIFIHSTNAKDNSTTFRITLPLYIEKDGE